MDINELKDLWKTTQTVEPNNNESIIKLMKENSISKVNKLLRGFRSETIFELIVNSLFFTHLLGICIQFSNQRAFLIPGLILLGLFTWDIGVKAYRLYELGQISFEPPILETQKRVERLKLSARRERLQLFAIIPVFSTAFIIVFGKAWLGLNLYEIMGTYLFNYFLGSLVVGAIIAILLLRFPDKKVQEASDFLKEIAEYEGS